MLAYGVERFHPRLTLACSFQKEESVLFHMLSELEPRGARAFTIDTGVLFPETLATWKRFEDRFRSRDRGDGRSQPRGAVDGAELLQRGQGRGARARRSPTSTPGSPASAASRPPPARGAPKLERDERRGIWKLNPLADWTEKDLWTYIFKHDLPYNPLHDQGYASIGCAPVHAARRRPRRPLGRRRQDRVRDPRGVMPRAHRIAPSTYQPAR